MPEKVKGFSVSQEKKGNIVHWYARKKVDGKMIRIYVGPEFDKAEEKITSWLEKHPETKERLENKRSPKRTKKTSDTIDKKQTSIETIEPKQVAIEPKQSTIEASETSETNELKEKVSRLEKEVESLKSKITILEDMIAQKMFIENKVNFTENKVNFDNLKLTLNQEEPIENKVNFTENKVNFDNLKLTSKKIKNNDYWYAVVRINGKQKWICVGRDKERAKEKLSQFYVIQGSKSNDNHIQNSDI